MSDTPNPVLIVTRPSPDASRFVAAVRAACRIEFDAIMSPLLEIVQLPIAPPVGKIAHLVLTSVNGVAAAARLGITRTTIAWCVGPRTTAAAKMLGFRTMPTNETAQDLLGAIIARIPAGPILYLRGKHTRVDIAKKLTEAGFPCMDLIAYDQIAIPLNSVAKSALKSKAVPILPLFSPRTAENLRTEIPADAQMLVVAMSPAVKDAFGNNGVLELRVAKAPNEPAMIDEVVAAITAQGNVMQP